MFFPLNWVVVAMAGVVAAILNHRVGLSWEWKPLGAVQQDKRSPYP